MLDTFEHNPCIQHLSGAWDIWASSYRR